MFSPRLKLDRQSAFWPDASRHRVDGEQRRFAAIDAAIAFNTIVLAESAGDFGTGIIPPGERYQVLKPLELATEAIDKDPDALHAYAAQAKAFMLLGRDREARAAFANLCGRLSAINQIMKRSLHGVVQNIAVDILTENWSRFGWQVFTITASQLGFRDGARDLFPHAQTMEIPFHPRGEV